MSDNILKSFSQRLALLYRGDCCISSSCKHLLDGLIKKTCTYMFLNTK